MKLLVVYYSLYGHVLQLARAVEEGAKSVAGVDVILRRVAEFDEVIRKTADNQHLVNVRDQQASNSSTRPPACGSRARWRASRPGSSLPLLPRTAARRRLC